MIPAEKRDKQRSDDRILVLRQGDKPKTSAGLVDSRLFNGQNKLHVIKNNQGLWSFKYEQGGLPEPLKQRFTRFEDALTFASRYFGKRDIKIEAIID